MTSFWALLKQAARPVDNSVKTNGTEMILSAMITAFNIITVVVYTLTRNKKAPNFFADTFATDA